MAYIINVKGSFAAAHALRDYGGPCEKTHGHNFKVTLTVAAQMLNDIGIAVDFKEIDKALGDVLEELDHNNLNELDYFNDRNATAENIAEFIYNRVTVAMTGFSATLQAVTIEESDKYAVTYTK
jgi:6-pyruvoyltetrahydropterin/6-carboxytetrahydropterin synthase